MYLHLATKSTTIPIFFNFLKLEIEQLYKEETVPEGIEPSTSRLTVARSATELRNP